jgi:hypothetical protein
VPQHSQATEEAAKAGLRVVGAMAATKAIMRNLKSLNEAELVFANITALVQRVGIKYKRAAKELGQLRRVLFTSAEPLENMGPLAVSTRKGFENRLCGFEALYVRIKHTRAAKELGQPRHVLVTNAEPLESMGPLAVRICFQQRLCGVHCCL